MNRTYAKERIEKATSIVVLTGAGVSAESGVPTFRGEEGLWKSYRPEELATPEAFELDPVLVWEWYDMRRNKLKGLEPNPAHLSIAKLERKTDNFTLITQNVDGLHRDAGSINIVELHGNIWCVRCTKCRKVTNNEDVPIEIPPYCNSCGGLLRPDIVWFGEMLPEEVITKAYAALERCEVMIVAGTSGVVQPAAAFAAQAKAGGAYVVEVNMEMTPNSTVADETILGRAGEVLPLLIG